jgi:hypothetical protein
MTAQPKNLLEYHLNEASARLTAQKLSDAARAKVERAVDAEPTLRTVVHKDQSGRTITEFTGSPRAWMQDFGMVPKRVIAINTK